MEKLKIIAYAYQNLAFLLVEKPVKLRNPHLCKVPDSGLQNQSKPRLADGIPLSLFLSLCLFPLFFASLLRNCEEEKRRREERDRGREREREVYHQQAWGSPVAKKIVCGAFALDIWLQKTHLATESAPHFEIAIHGLQIATGGGEAFRNDCNKQDT